MNDSPFSLTTTFHIGPLPVSQPVIISWGIIALLAIVTFALTRRVELRPSWWQAILELIVSALDAQIRSTIRGDPARFRSLIGTLFLFILIANWSSLVPGVEPPTAHLETDAVLALIAW